MRIAKIAFNKLNPKDARHACEQWERWGGDMDDFVRIDRKLYPIDQLRKGGVKGYKLVAEKDSYAIVEKET